MNEKYYHKIHEPFIIDPAKWKEYRKISHVVNAVQVWDDWYVETLEGTMHAKLGDYIILGIKGEPYVCDKSIFKELYEPA